MTSAPGTAQTRPRLVVVYGHRSLDLMQIVEGARGWCDLVWLVDADDPSVVAVRPILRKFGPVVGALGAAPERAADALRAHSPDGLATFYDTGMERVAAVAECLGLPFHTAEAARNLEDKLFQREALRSAGLPTPAEKWVVGNIVPTGQTESAENVDAALGPFVAPCQHRVRFANPDELVHMEDLAPGGIKRWLVPVHPRRPQGRPALRSEAVRRVPR